MLLGPSGVAFADVSVVVPTYNGLTRGYIFQALDSVLGQSLPPREIIVVDDGSSDATAATIRQRYGAKIRVETQSNGGTAKARNFGLRLATGAYVAFLDDDDEFLPTKLQDQVAFLEAHKDVGMVFSAATTIDAEGRHLGVLTSSGVGLDFPAAIVGNDFLLPITVLVRRSAVPQLYFDEAIKLNEDYDYFVRLCERTKVAYCNLPSCLYRVHLTRKTHDEMALERANLTVVALHAQRLYGAGSGEIVRFYCYGAVCRALLKRRMSFAGEMFRAGGAGIQPAVFLSRLVGVVLAPLPRLKRHWRRMEIRAVLRRAQRLAGAAPG